MMGRAFHIAPLCTLCLIGFIAARDTRLPDVVPNDNRAPAGRLSNDTLRLDLEVRMATWRPQADTGPAIDVAAFAEVGKAPRIPGPLIRVPAGTVILARVRNSLTDSTISIHGLMTRPAQAWDSVVLRPGEARELRFEAGAAGTYVYRAVLGKHSLDRRTNDEREQVAGVFVVDPPGGSPPDRVMMINIWGSRLDPAQPFSGQNYRNALAINGRSWPWTERFDARVGDTIRWRVVNASGRAHPMHLHGFYFNVESRSNGLAERRFEPADRPAAVTETVPTFAALGLNIVPDRPGNWLFHCHLGFHVVPGARLDKPKPGSRDAMAHDAGQHMAGLVVGIRVHPRPGMTAPARTDPARFRLLVQEGPKRHRSARALGYVLQHGDTPPGPDSVLIPGPLLVLTRDRPTDITVVNRLREPTAVHWHGIELESYYDGVAGWSGADTTLAPSIMPGDSFIARLTLPRAGTFIYHTHLNDLEQIAGGLYGALVVLEPGQKFHPDRDHVFVIGWDSPGDPPRILMNGDSLPPPLELAANVPHRFRLVNIGVAQIANVSVLQDTTVMRWRKLAKDGADLPPAQAVLVPARQAINVGETYDFEVTLPPGEYRIAGRNQNGNFYDRRLIVR